MGVSDLECPNCGAQVDFAGGTQTTCSFCQSKLYLSSDGVKVSSVLNDLLEGKPATTAGVDVARVDQLARAGKKIEAIKLLREQTGLGLKDAKEAVEAIERGESVNLSPAPTTSVHVVSGVDTARVTQLLMQGKKVDAIKLVREETGLGLKEATDVVDALGATRYSPPPRTRTSRSGCLGCLPLLLFMGLCAGFIMLTSQVAFRAWGPLDQVLNLINTNPQVTQIFGTPITTGPFITGKISSGGSSSSASLDVPIYGPKQSGDMSVSGSWRKGLWDLTIWVTYTGSDGEEQTIHLSQKVK